MKKPPVDTTSTTKTDNYLFGDKTLIGYANRKFFELFVNTCKSEKIYSVQTEDFPEDIPAVIYIPEKNKNIDWPSEEPSVGTKHIYVRLSDELIEFLAERGVVAAGYNYKYDPYKVSNQKYFILDHAWVIPSAFRWEDADPIEDEEIEADDPYYPHPEDAEPEITEEEQQAKLNRKRAVIATAIALITLLR